MSKSTCILTINGSPVRCRPGETLLDAALGGRIVLPHDCCSGQCETCRVRVISGPIDPQGTADRDTVLGCLATVEGDAEVTYDAVPVVRKTAAVVEEIASLGAPFVEVKLRPTRQIPWLPGQYVRLGFRGFPPRDFSPTFPLDLAREEGLISFHVRRYPGGIVSAALGDAIRVGHKVSIRGPFGSAFLRHQTEPLILASSGAGFAPIWAMAVASVLGQPTRPLLVVATASRASHLYMRGAVNWLADRGVPTVLTASDGDGQQVLRVGPVEVLAPLEKTDIVYAAGTPSMVESVHQIAIAAGAKFYSDPFYQSKQSLRDLIMRFRSPRSDDDRGQPGATSAMRPPVGRRRIAAIDRPTEQRKRTLAPGVR